jgi:hypothetical protein
VVVDHLSAAYALRRQAPGADPPAHSLRVASDQSGDFGDGERGAMLRRYADTTRASNASGPGGRQCYEEAAGEVSGGSANGTPRK